MPGQELAIAEDVALRGLWLLVRWDLVGCPTWTRLSLEEERKPGHVEYADVALTVDRGGARALVRWDPEWGARLEPVWGQRQVGPRVGCST
jgi:hypothetical protein